MTAFKKTIASALVAASLSTPLKANASPEAEWTGAILGGVVGGVAGHQFGKGEGNVVSTIGGAALGVLLGLEVARALGRDSREVRPPKVNYEELKTRRFIECQASECGSFFRVKYINQRQPRRAGDHECFEYAIYPSYGNNKHYFACLNDDNRWEKVERNEVGQVVFPDQRVQDPVVQPLPPQAPPQQYLSPFTGDEFAWVDRDISGAGDESNMLRFLNFHLRDFARRGRGLSLNQANYLLRHFVVRSDEARTIMTPFVIQ